METPFEVTRQTPRAFEVINGGAAFAIRREVEAPNVLVCTYGAAGDDMTNRIKWQSVPIAIRRAAREHFTGSVERRAA